MRIAYVTSDFGVPVNGAKGASVHVRQMVNELSALGHELLILTPSPGDEAASLLPCPVVHVPLAGPLPAFYEELKQEEICRGNRLSKDLRNLLYALSMELGAGPLLDEFQPHVVYERYSLFGTAGLQLSRRYAAPLILEVNAPLVDEQAQQRGLTLPLVARASERWLFERADHVTVVSGWLERHVKSLGVSDDRVTVIPNAADPELFKPPAGPSAVRHELGWSDAFVIGFVGSMKDWHGVGTLLDSLQMLNEPAGRFRLLLVGAGAEFSALEQRVAELGLGRHVHMSGAVPHHDVPRWIAAMDVAVAPYAASAEAYFSPLKLFEYMSMGRPVIAARIGQSTEIVEDCRTGWFYPPGDSRALSERIRWLSEHPQRARQAGRMARRQILSCYTWRKNAERVAAIAERLLHEKRGNTPRRSLVSAVEAAPAH
jgi:glycosyltransferase involved in cell wall biosynthesis